MDADVRIPHAVPLLRNFPKLDNLDLDLQDQSLSDEEIDQLKALTGLRRLAINNAKGTEVPFAQDCGFQEECTRLGTESSRVGF